MFLVDKYYHDSNMITCHEDILEKLLDSFDAHSDIYRNVNKLKKKGFSNI